MTVIPLIAGAILVGIASTPDLKTVGAVGARAIVLFLIALTVAAAFSTTIAKPLLSYLTIDPAAAAALRASAVESSASAVESAQKIVSLKQWLIDLVPVNPIKAAADGAMLPLIVFLVAFGVAMTRAAEPGKTTFLNGARAVTEAAMTLVRWLLFAAPLAVFVLSAAVATRLGITAAGAVLFYMALVCGLCALFMALLYLGAVVATRGGSKGLARVFAPALAVAFTSRSSMVALPAMIEASTALKQPFVVRSFFLPLAVATFRIGAAINLPIGVLFLARLYGVELTTAQLLSITLASVVTTFSVPGVPSGSIIVMVPVLLAANVPVAGIGILIGVDTLPDMFRTATNATGDLSLATILSRNIVDEARDASRPPPLETVPL
jgi:Na+/H+-dicarboxylate symporter